MTNVPSDKPQANDLPSKLKEHERILFSSCAILSNLFSFRFQTRTVLSSLAVANIFLSIDETASDHNSPSE